MKKYKMEEMLPEEFIQAVREMPVFLIPTGLLEWHGDHLPLGLDSLKAYGLCLKTAEKLGGGVVLPANYFGRPGYSSYVGTLTFSEACIDLLFTELFQQLKKVGAKVIVVLTGHYGPCQVDCIKRVAKYFCTENPDIRIIAQAEYEGIEIDGNVPADHAGKWETSMFWYMYPELTRMDNFKNETKTKKLYDNPTQNFYHEQEHWQCVHDLSATASPELGKRCVDAITDRLSKIILELLQE